MTEAEEKAVEYLKANSLVRLNENNEVVAYGNAHKYYIINLIEKLQKENERKHDIIIEKDRQLHLMHKEIQNVREQAREIIDKPLKDLLMLNTPKIIIESKEDLKGLLDNYIPKSKIKELLKEHHIEFGKETIAMSEQGAFGFMLSIKEILEEG